MLVELAAHDLGVIEDLRLVLGSGMTALTGETGAGKTLVVDAIDLLVGARADPAVVRPGAVEARVEGRFTYEGPDGEHEVVLSRAIPANGRSRAYVDGRPVTVAELAERGGALVELHGQHAHQSLLSPAVQRASLDRFAGVDLAALLAARSRVREIEALLAALGGDERARAREIDILRFQVDELAAAGLHDDDEDLSLEREESMLSGAVGHLEAAGVALAALGEEGAGEPIGRAISALVGHPPFSDLEARLRASAAELDEVARDLRAAAEGIQDDPERLQVLRERRQLLRDLRRKYGDSIAEVREFERQAAARLGELEQHDRRAGQLEDERAQAMAEVASAAAVVAAARGAAAPDLASAVASHLGQLALGRARVEVSVGGEDPCDDVQILLAANPGLPALPLSKVASGGELARTMLALRMVLTAGPPTLVFDEVDAGIGGEAAVAVGRALSSLAGDRQVLVVTHLPQVAAFADAHVRVSKQTGEDRTVAEVEVLDDQGRVAELSRMLSGQPESTTARDHASELLATASQARREAR